jgi:hypothetical protein
MFGSGERARHACRPSADSLSRSLCACTHIFPLRAHTKMRLFHDAFLHIQAPKRISPGPRTAQRGASCTVRSSFESSACSVTLDWNLGRWNSAKFCDDRLGHSAFRHASFASAHYLEQVVHWKQQFRLSPGSQRQEAHAEASTARARRDLRRRVIQQLAHKVAALL